MQTIDYVFLTGVAILLLGAGKTVLTTKQTLDETLPNAAPAAPPGAPVQLRRHHHMGKNKGTRGNNTQHVKAPSGEFVLAQPRLSRNKTGVAA